MTRRAGNAIFILSFALVPWVLHACSMAANVLEDRPSKDEFMDGGLGGTMAMMAAGGSTPAGGSGGVPSMAGTFSVGGAIAAGGGPAAGGVPSDPRAEERRVLAEKLCSIPTFYPCLTLEVSGAPRGATAEELKTLCRQKTEASQYNTFTDQCFSQWVSNASCALERTDYCPCDTDAGACTFSPESNAFGRGCDGTATELSACAQFKNFGTELGPAGPYEWVSGQTGCGVNGRAKNGLDTIEASCKGPLNGVQACTCVVNGIPLFDNVLSLTGVENTFYADDCQNVALELAGGRCADVLDCCYSRVADGICACGAHPDRAGYSSCAALATASLAVVVDHCPSYRPAP